MIHFHRAGLFFGRPQAVALAVALPLLVSATASPLFAQDNQTKELVSKVDRLQRELLDLQRTVYQGAPPPQAGATPGGDVNTTQAARIELRLQQFERALQSLTGQVEELGFTADENKRRLDALSAEMERQMQAGDGGMGGGALVLEGTPGPAGDGGAGAALPAGNAAAATAGQGSAGQDLASQGSAGQGSAGQGGGAEPESLAAAAAAAPSGQTAALTGSDQDQYNQAFALLRQGDYPGAEAALRSFIAGNPASPLVGNAKYWLGETYYARSDYQQAAVTFAEAYQEYPDGSKAPDNLLKLGMSLASLNATEDACGTFAELLSRYPNANSSIRRRAELEREKHNCP